MNISSKPSSSGGAAQNFVAVLVGFIVCLAGPPALAEKEAFTPEHIARLKSVTSVKMAPDGQYIAYTVSVPRTPFVDDSGKPWTELHVVDRQASSRPFVTGKGALSGVQWTPDGKGISFLAKRGDDKKNALYVIPIDGGEARRVLSAETGVGSYTWSPDSLRVAYLAKPKEDGDKKKLKEKGFDAEVVEEDMRLVGVWIARIDDDEARPSMLALDGSASALHWSPTGSHLAVALAPSALIDDTYMARKLHVIDADSAKVVARFDNPGKLGKVAWSPDGNHLAVLSAEDLNDPSAGRLMVASMGKSTLTDILPNFMGAVHDIAWQDADTIMFLTGEGVWTTMQKIDIDGQGRKTLVPNGELILSALSVSSDGQSAALRVNTGLHPNEVYMMSHGEAVPTRRTDTNPWLADMRFAKQEAVKFKARDGMMIEGVLYHPLDEEAGQRYPLILAVHGGPEAHESCGWRTDYSRPGQLGAARGFAVMYINYRGSTGRGVAFSKLGQADYGGAEFDDLVDAVSHLVEIGLVEKERVGVTGGSYGGYAAAWCATKLSEHFAASVMFVGISDQISKFGTTDIPKESYLVHARMRPWDDWQFFLERSPVYHIKNCRTPILIMHGKNDPRVHPGQSMEMYRYLKTLNQSPVRLVFFPGEGHGNRKSCSRYDYSLRMLRWFEHYLKGPGGDPPTGDLDYKKSAWTGEDVEEEAD